MSEARREACRASRFFYWPSLFFQKRVEVFFFEKLQLFFDFFEFPFSTSVKFVVNDFDFKIQFLNL